MKRTKRQENAIIINFSLYLVLFIAAWLFFLYYIIPNVLAIEEKKSETLDVYSKIQNTKKSGVPFSVFKKSTQKWALRSFFTSEQKVNIEYVDSILKDLKPNFYNKYFINKWESDYKSFIEELKDSYKEKDNLDEKLWIISKILPSYSEKIYDIDEENLLSDLRFINYIESIIYEFNLSYENPIWIGSVKLIPNYTIWTDESNSFDKNIFYIPLELDLEWSKASIIYFLHFINNVWKIYLDEDWEIALFKDENYPKNDFFFNFKFKNIWNKKEISKYNIFNNQVIDIETISFSDYINSSFNPLDILNNETDLVKFLKNTGQMDEKFKLNVKLRFYVKWLPKYKIENFIKNFKKDFTDTEKLVKENLKNQDLSTLDRNKLQQINTSLWSIKKSVNSLSQTAKGSKLTDNYNSAYKYNMLLSEEKQKINNIINKKWDTKK